MRKPLPQNCTACRQGPGHRLVGHASSLAAARLPAVALVSALDANASRRSPVAAGGGVCCHASATVLRATRHHSPGRATHGCTHSFAPPASERSVVLPANDSSSVHKSVAAPEDICLPAAAQTLHSHPQAAAAPEELADGWTALAQRRMSRTARRMLPHRTSKPDAGCMQVNKCCRRAELYRI